MSAPRETGNDAAPTCGPAKPALHLKRREEHRLRNGHPWVFSNEVDVSRSPLASFEAGEEVDVFARGGRCLGTALVNPRSLICGRLLSTRGGFELTGERIEERVREALALRERLFDRPYYRLVFAESDALPGLVVDRHGEVLCVQLNSAGMEQRRGAVLEALVNAVQPRVVVLRNDAPGRAQEGLDATVETVLGEPPDSTVIEENGCRFEIDAIAGQKTGWFYDHRANRALVAGMARGARVLDVFSYSGAWGVQAAAAGARSVLCVDSSRPALEQAVVNAGLNGFADTLGVEHGDAFDVLKDLHARRQRFELVVTDPPAFVRRRKDLESGAEAYQRLARLAMQVLVDDGILVSASCSSHLDAARLLELARRAARSLGKRLQVLAQGHQAPDHPILPGFPESAYLKVFVLRVLA